MAEIYSKASRVIAWLGRAEEDGERALEAICRAADDTASTVVVLAHLGTTDTQQHPCIVLARCIQLLQEVAAGRNVLVKVCICRDGWIRILCRSELEIV